MNLPQPFVQSACLIDKFPLNVRNDGVNDLLQLRGEHITASAFDVVLQNHPFVPANACAAILHEFRNERRRLWEQRTLAKYAKDGRTPPNNWLSRYVEAAPPKTDDLPELPGGWCWASMDQVFSVVRNGTAVVPRAQSGVAILRISAVRPLRVDMTDVRFLTTSEADAADSWVEAGDLFFTRYNGSTRFCGVCGRIESISFPVAYPDKLIKCQVVPALVDGAFVEIAANAGYSRAAIESRLRTTAGQVGVSGTDIKNTPLPLPTLAEQSAIVEAVNEKLSQIDAMEAEVERGLARAARLRQAILKAAFAGKLVPQNPDDEPAAKLLERIKAEREVELPRANGAGKPKRRAASVG